MKGFKNQDKECWQCRDCRKDSKYKVNPPIPKGWIDDKQLGLLCPDCYIRRRNRK